MKKLIIILLLFNSILSWGAKYFIAPNGNDITGSGTISAPYFSLVKAWSYVAAGDTIYMRGGTYEFTAIQTLSSRSGAPGNYIKILPYQLEKPILTRATTITGGTWPMALVRLVSSDYVYIKGLEITGFYQDLALASICSGLSLYMSDNCIIEEIDSHHNGHGILIYQSGNSQIINCDTHHNYDPIDPHGSDPYGDGDGLEVSDLGEGTWTIIRGHRSWNNSDDGIDLWDSQMGVTIEGCWAWGNGYREDGVTTGGDGNGIKLGRLGNGITKYDQHLRTITNNLSFNNRQTGFSQNDTRCIIYLYNNTSFGNPTGYALFAMGTAVNQIRNNISFNNTTNGTFHSYDGISNNTFLYNGTTNTSYALTEDDFASVDSTGCSNQRQLWGELPKTSFLRLAPGSDLINAGYDVGRSYYGTDPDIGAYERWGTTYYVKAGGNDNLAGTSDATAWATLSKVNGITFTKGDSILFRRGDTFRGSLYQDEDGHASAYIVYGAYGTGDRPKIFGSKDLSATGEWVLHAGNVWKTSATLGTLQDDISNVVFNNEAFVGYKKKTIDSLNAQGKFWYNTADDLLYLYSVSNPGSFYTRIEAAGHHDIHQGLLKWRNSSYIKLENLDIRYTSGAGIETDECNRIIIDNCNVSFVGGEWLYRTGADLRRLGNGYSFILNNDSIIVRNSTAHECYDAGISPQTWVNNTSMTNMWFYNNVITNSYYSYEAWASLTHTLTNIHFYNNTSISPGNCFSNTSLQRPDYTNSSHVIMWDLRGLAADVTILNNIFSGNCNVALRLDDNVNKLTVDYNLFNVTRVGYTNESTYYNTLAQWQAAMSQDANSVSADPLFAGASDFRLRATSPARNAGTDLKLVYDYVGTLRDASHDIGAYEYYPLISPSRLLRSRNGVFLKSSTGDLQINQ